MAGASQALTNPDTFEDTSFTAPLGSGPYTVTAVRPGDSVTFTRDKNYWGRDLPINQGLWNFDSIRYTYYRDGNNAFRGVQKKVSTTCVRKPIRAVGRPPIIFRRCATAA